MDLCPLSICRKDQFDMNNDLQAFLNEGSMNNIDVLKVQKVACTWEERMHYTLAFSDDANRDMIQGGFFSLERCKMSLKAGQSSSTSACAFSTKSSQSTECQSATSIPAAAQSTCRWSQRDPVGVITLYLVLSLRGPVSTCE